MKSAVKATRKVTVKSAVSAPKSKPKKKLSKLDPNYYSKIGHLSAKARKMTSEQMSEIEKLSHPRKSGYHGGRKKKTDEGSTPAAVA